MATEGDAAEVPGSPRTYAEAVNEPSAADEATLSPAMVGEGRPNSQDDVADGQGEQGALPEANGRMESGVALQDGNGGEDGAFPYAKVAEQAAVPESNAGEKAGGGDQGSVPQVEEPRGVPQSENETPTANGELKEQNLEQGAGAPQANGWEKTAVSEVTDESVEWGFERKEMYEKPLAGSVQLYERHVFLCYKDPESWPSQVEAAEDRLPRSLASALKARRGDMPRKTRMTVCETDKDSNNGDVLIFPEMVKYKALSHADVDPFVDEVLVHGRSWRQVPSERLTETYVFVCAHGSKDMRCGFCGPPLIQKFRQEIEKAQLVGQVTVRACSHVGGHKYAGNVIIYRRSEDQQVQGHWFGYVTPDDVPVLLEEHIGKGEIIERLWRGQMGIGEDDQKESQKRRMDVREAERECACAKAVENGVEVKGDFCCQTVVVPVVEPLHASPATIEHAERILTSRVPRWFKLPSWMATWERGDTVAALSLVGAASAVVAAYYVIRATRD